MVSIFSCINKHSIGFASKFCLDSLSSFFPFALRGVWDACSVRVADMGTIDETKQRVLDNFFFAICKQLLKIHDVCQEEFYVCKALAKDLSQWDFLVATQQNAFKTFAAHQVQCHLGTVFVFFFFISVVYTLSTAEE